MGFSEAEYRTILENLKRSRGRRRDAVKVAEETFGNALPKKRAQGKPRAKRKPLYQRSKPEERTLGGVTFASKAEKRFAEKLHMEKAEKPGMWWVRQPVFDLAGVQYKPDFLVVRPESIYAPAHRFEHVTVYEIKPKLREPFRSEALRTFHRNAAQVKALWGIEIELVEVE